MGGNKPTSQSKARILTPFSDYVPAVSRLDGTISSKRVTQNHETVISKNAKGPTTSNLSVILTI